MEESRRDYDIVAAAASAAGISASGDSDVGQAEAVDHSGVAEYVPTPIAELERCRARLPSPAAAIPDDEGQTGQQVQAASPRILQPIGQLESCRSRLPSPAAAALDGEGQMGLRVPGATQCILELMEPLDDTESQKTTGETSGEAQASSKSERCPQTSAKKPKPHKFFAEKTIQSKLSQSKESVKGKTVTSTATQVEKDLHFRRTAERKVLFFGERDVKRRWTFPLNFTGHDSPSIPTSPSTSTTAR